MTDQEILTKAIVKAFGKVTELRFNLYTISYFSDFDDEDALSVWASKETLIFSHKFAKAFWGETMFEYEIEVGPDGGTVYDVASLPAWQYHLQQMVLEENPIKYLEKFIQSNNQ